MPNKDANHDIVVRALKKAGWDILKEQKSYTIGAAEDLRRLYIDIHAVNTANKIILIEVKNIEKSPVHELMQLVGQYVVYRAILDYLKDGTALYVAISEEAYNTIILHPLGQEVLKMVFIPFLTYHSEKEELLQWIPPL